MTCKDSGRETVESVGVEKEGRIRGLLVKTG